ncbi:MAG: hypothetical protein HYU38_04825 [Candidatus Tectomicrobia bacterium]|nr:hypothetical protein [Candidatus Tectomicrobia bacterium]
MKAGLSRRRRWRKLAGIASAPAVLGGGIWFLASSPTVTDADTRFVLPATPRVPRPLTLDPAQFAGKTREAYAVARRYPELLERMPCYCGCYESAGHQNNLDCYADQHAFG